MEYCIDTWARRWRLAPRVTFGDQGKAEHAGPVQYPARLLLPPCLAGIVLLAIGEGSWRGMFAAVLCMLLDIMLGALVYCFAKLRVAALLPMLDKDEVIRLARFVMSPVFGIEALRIIVAMVISYQGNGHLGPLFREVFDVRALFSNPSEILTVGAFAVLALRLYFAIRQLNKVRPARMLLANGGLMIGALAVSYWVAGLGIMWGMCATLNCAAA